MLPEVTDLRRNNTHRLIPSAYARQDAPQDESVLVRLTSDPQNLAALFELEGATNDRLLGEAGLLPGITVRELVFGLSYSHIVNAAFTHARPNGSRFNAPDRGAWYAGFSRETAAIEMAYHKKIELQEIHWQEKETFTYVDFLADFRGQFHDLRNDPSFKNCLDPNSYSASQQLAAATSQRGINWRHLYQRSPQGRNLHRLFPPGTSEQCSQRSVCFHRVRKRPRRSPNSRNQGLGDVRLHHCHRAHAAPTLLSLCKNAPPRTKMTWS